MRPTPAETATAVGRLLEEWAADETQSQHMRWMLRRVSGVLAQTDWEDASAAIEESNARLMSTLEAALILIDNLDPVAAEKYDPARARIRAAMTGAGRSAQQRTSLQERNELNEMLRGAVDEFVATLEADHAPKGHDGRRRQGYRCLLEALDDL